MSHSRSHRYEPAVPASAPIGRPRYILDRAGVRAVDRAAIQEYGIPGVVLMENASRALADAARAMLPRAGRALIVCGRGNNGGDGWALARHLHNEGFVPQVATLGTPAPESDAGINHAVACRMGIAVGDAEDVRVGPEVDLVVDALFGTGLDRPVAGIAARVIDLINAASRPVLAVDVPSGLDCDTGRPLGVAVRAARTVTFVAEKPGFAVLEAQPYLGVVTVAGIGAPVELTRRFAREAPPRADDPERDDARPAPA